MNRMEFISMRDFRTQTTQIWSKLSNGEEIVITNNGRPRAFLIEIPDGYFDEMLTGIRRAKDQIKPRLSARGYYKHEPKPLTHRYSQDEKNAAMDEIREMLADTDWSDVDIKKERAERRAAKYEPTT